MFIKQSKSKETVKNKNVGSLFVLILITCLLVIIIINLFQLIDLIGNIKELNEKLKMLSNVSNNYASLNELKITYIIQLVKSIFVLIAEISGLFICRYFNDILLKNE